jgi:hypothetical protein
MTKHHGLDDKQIDDGNLSLPDLAHFEWAITAYTTSGLPATFSGTKISGEKDLYFIKQIYRDSNELPYRVTESLYKNSDNTLRWQKDTTINRINGVFAGTSGTIITGENSDQ